MAGTIPIIQHSTLDDAYMHLPVAFVDNWDELLAPANSSVLTSMLNRWMKELQPYYVQGSELRRKTLDVSELAGGFLFCFESFLLMLLSLWDFRELLL